MIYNLHKRQTGVALILTLIIMNLLLFLGMYFASFTITDYKITNSHSQAMRGYYLAEAGLHEMIYKLKNDDTYRVPFETDPDWSVELTRDNVFDSNDSYTITVQNSGVAHGELFASSSIDLIDTTTARRVVKTSVFKAIGQSGVASSTAYADGDIDISLSVVNFLEGSAHSNNVFTVNGASTITIDEDLEAVGNYNKLWMSTVNVGGETHAANYPPAAAEIDMPAVDFDSSDPNSYKNRADIVYSSGDFEDLMENNQNLTLNGPITYVAGDINLRGGQQLTVNGLLVAERDIIIGHSWCWGLRCGNSSITVNHVAGQPAGLMAKKKLEFKLWTGNVNINGIAYANDQLLIVSFPMGYAFESHGGLVSRKLTITSAWQAINIYHDNNILVETLGPTTLSPVINIEHWEEEY